MSESRSGVVSGASDAALSPALVRVLLLIRDIRSTTWGHEAWPHVKPLLRQALEMRRQIAREGWWN
jgi:hypothetical protein